MKKIIHTIVACAFVCFMASCDDMNSIHQEWLDRGANVYLGIPVVQESSNGFGRVELVWTLNIDPRIIETRIFWNNRQDSVVVPAPAPAVRTTPITQILTLPEGSYVFELVSANQAGNRSIASQIAAESFGERFQRTLRNRVVNAVMQPDSSVVLTWNVEDRVLRTYLTYVNRYDVEITKIIETNQTTVSLDDFPPGGEFTHWSMYRPLRSIDEVASLPATGQFPL